MLFNRCSDYVAEVNRQWVLDDHTNPDVVATLDKDAFINAARDEIAMELLCIPHEDAISWAAGTASQVVSTSSILTIDTVFWGADELDPIQTRGDYYALKLEASSGTPEKFYIAEDLKTIFLYPTPDTAGTLNVMAFRLPDNLRSTDFSLALTSNLVSGSTTASDGAMNTSTLEVGMGISGTHIPSGTIIEELLSTTSLRMSQAASASATGETLTFTKTALAVESEIPLIARPAVPLWALAQIYNRDPFNEDQKTKAAFYLQKFNTEMGKAKSRASRARHLGKAGSIVPR